MLDSHERDRAKARNGGIVGDKAVSAVRRLECDAQASFCHDRVKVVCNWTPYLAGARVRASFAPKENLPNSVPQSRPAKQLYAVYKNLPRLVARKHSKDRSVEPNKRGVHRRKRNGKPNRQTEDGQAIFKADGTRLVSGETGDKAFHRRCPP